MNNYRKTARIVGVVYLLGFVVGLTGEGLIQSVLGTPDRLATISANGTMLAIGALLWLMAAAGDAAPGVLLFPILRQHHERVAFGYIGARIIDAVFTAVMVLFALLQIPLASEYLKAGAADTSYLHALSAVVLQAQLYAYNIAMITLGFAGVMLNYTLYKAKLIPRPLAIWGLVGNAIISGGMISEVMGSGLGLASTIPGGLWEVFIGVWLIVKGLSSATTAGESAPAGHRAVAAIQPQLT